ncbi:MAG: hypothetical protein LBL24_06585 [Bacteroidales bacterium]|jgi:hypothetical protein|nr:hypothetical protein [Bacteroidales bacterium]
MYRVHSSTISVPLVIYRVHSSTIDVPLVIYRVHSSTIDVVTVTNRVRFTTDIRVNNNNKTTILWAFPVRETISIEKIEKICTATGSKPRMGFHMVNHLRRLVDVLRIDSMDSLWYGELI